MSETVWHKGTIEKVEFDIPLEDKCKELTDGELDSYYDDYTEYFACGESKDYIVIDNTLYRFIKNDTLDADGEVISATKNGDGSIDYELRFYNGGGCFSEVLGMALNKL